MGRARLDGAMRRAAAAILATLTLGGPPARADERARPSPDVLALRSQATAPAARAAAARRLGEAPEGRRDEAVAALGEALDDASAGVRAEAAVALARLRDERAMPRLERRLSVEEEEEVLAPLLLAIGATGGRYAVDPVARRCDDRRVRVRAAAATALGDLGGEVARQRLLSLLRAASADPEWVVRSAAMLGLASCGKPSDAGVVLEAFRDGGGGSWWLARASLARVVATLDADPLPVLDRLMADPDARVASAAALALLRSGRRTDLLRRLSDASPSVRAAAAAACGEVPEAAGRLRDAAFSDRDRSVRWSAALALSRLDDPVSDALLVEGIASEDPAVSLAALAECRRKTGAEIGRDPAAWRSRLAERRRGR
jgi:HEAT repeat protein